MYIHYLYHSHSRVCILPAVDLCEGGDEARLLDFHLLQHVLDHLAHLADRLCRRRLPCVNSLVVVLVDLEQQLGLRRQHLGARAFQQHDGPDFAGKGVELVSAVKNTVVSKLCPRQSQESWKALYCPRGDQVISHPMRSQAQLTMRRQLSQKAPLLFICYFFKL